MTNKLKTRQIAIDADIMRKMKILAAQHDRKLKEMVNEALNDYIETFEGAGK